MHQHELENKLKGLRSEMKPDSTWTAATKAQVLAVREERPQQEVYTPGRRLGITQIVVRRILGHRLAVAGVSALVLVGGVLAVSRDAVPGDFFFPVKQTVEQAQMETSGGDDEQLLARLETAERRLEELAAIAAENDTRKLAPALAEYEESTAQTAREITEQTKEDTSEDVADSIALKTQRLQQKERELEETLATEIGGSEELSAANQRLQYKSIASSLIERFEDASLTDEQKELFTEGKTAFEAENYQQAFDVLLKIGSLTNE